MRRKTFTLACGALALALGAAAEEQGRVVAVRSRSDDRASSVEIDGDRPLSFTTMKLLSPPRVVVDFADAVIDAEQRELEIEDGTLRRAALAQAGSRTARVVIVLAVDAEFDVRADGNRVEVRVPRPGAIATSDAPGDAEAEKVASLPKVSLVGSKPAQPPEDGAASRPRTAAEKAEALKKALAEQRHREAEEKAARKLARKGGGKVAMKPPAFAPAKTAVDTPADSAPTPVAPAEKAAAKVADVETREPVAERRQTIPEPRPEPGE
ncbi:MAG: AMIN domain-containing protein, partial [Myxococcales bacterium]